MHLVVGRGKWLHASAQGLRKPHVVTRRDSFSTSHSALRTDFLAHAKVTSVNPDAEEESQQSHLFRLQIILGRKQVPILRHYRRFAHQV